MLCSNIVARFSSEKLFLQKQQAGNCEAKNRELPSHSTNTSQKPTQVTSYYNLCLATKKRLCFSLVLMKEPKPLTVKTDQIELVRQQDKTVHSDINVASSFESRPFQPCKHFSVHHNKFISEDQFLVKSESVKRILEFNLSPNHCRPRCLFRGLFCVMLF